MMQRLVWLSARWKQMQLGHRLRGGQAPKATAAWQHSTKVHCMQICNNSVNPLQFRSYFLFLKPSCPEVFSLQGFHALSCTFCPEYLLNLLVYQGMSRGEFHTVLIIFHLSRTFPASIKDSFVALLQTKILKHVCYLVFCSAIVNVGLKKMDVVIKLLYPQERVFGLVNQVARAHRPRQGWHEESAEEGS